MHWGRNIFNLQKHERHPSLLRNANHSSLAARVRQITCTYIHVYIMVDRERDSPSDNLNSRASQLMQIARKRWGTMKLEEQTFALCFLQKLLNIWVLSGGGRRNFFFPWCKVFYEWESLKNLHRNFFLWFYGIFGKITFGF